jgi:hypothetical protein
MEKVSLLGPEDFSGMGEGKTGNSKDIIPQHYAARPPAKHYLKIQCRIISYLYFL